MKFCHKIKGNKSNGMPRHLIFYDTETNQKELDSGYTKHSLRLGCAIYVRRAYKDHKRQEVKILFDTIKEFWDFVVDHAPEKQSLYLYACNQSFDFSVMQGLKELPDRGFHLPTFKVNNPDSKHFNSNMPTYEKSAFIIDNNIFMLKYRNGSKLIHVLDTFNLEPISVKTMGQWIGLEKLECDFDNVSDSDLETYCIRDTEIIKEFVLRCIQFMVDHDCGYFKPTVANISFNAFRHRFMHQDIFVHDNLDAIALERSSYRGGRCDCYQIGEFSDDTYYYLDINAMYSYILKNMPLPYKLIRYYKNPKYHQFLCLLPYNSIIINANITIDQPAIALKKEKLIFPIGTFNVSLTHPEIAWVMKYGTINHIYEMAIYKDAILFDQFVDYFSKIKQNVDGKYTLFEEKWAKRLLNSQYGRWGLKIEPYEVVESINDSEDSIERYYDIDNHQWIYDIIIDGKRYRKGESIEGKDSFVAIPTFVTGYARMMLWDYMQIAGMENLFYTDTDSLFVNEQGFDNLALERSKTELGKLKLEKFSNYIKIVAPKNYQFGDDRKIKGIRANSKQIKPNTYQNTNFLKIKSLLKNKLNDGAYTKEVMKTVKGIYDKGIVESDGNVGPFTLDEPILEE